VNCEMTGFPIGAAVAYPGDSAVATAAGKHGWLALAESPNARTAPAA